MRISDWSSDVCSSDLGTPARIDRKRAITTLGIVGLMVLANTLFGVEILWSAVGAAVAVLLAGCVSFRELRESLDLRLIAVIACSFALGAAKIGRASCRERVCQYG